MPVYSGEMFTWSNGIGVIERSSLPTAFATRLYDDACDVGFRVQSHRTGKEKLFTFSRYEWAGRVDGERVEVWCSGDIEIHVLND